MKIFFLLLLLTLIIVLNAEHITIPENNRSPLIEFSSEDLSETEITFNLSSYELEKKIEGDIEYSVISIPDEGEILDFGKPDLPRITRLFAIPDHGDVDVEVNWFNETSTENIIIYPQQQLKSESSREDIPFTIDSDYYAKGGKFPEQNIVIGDPVILRDQRIVPVSFFPFQYDPIKRELKVITNINLTLRIQGRGGINVKENTRKRSRSFEKIYESVITNYEKLDTRSGEYQTPSYLFIFPDDTQIGNYLQNLVDWKHQKGFEVTAVSTVTTGTTSIAITNFIQDAYNNWENPPEYVCLVGDAGGAFHIPTGHYSTPPYGGEGDHIYAMLEGDDVLADVIVGRLSFNSTMEFQTILSKILNYETMPYTDNSDWFNNALMVGDPSDSGQSCVDTKMYIKDMIDEFAPNIESEEIYSGNWVIGMANALNDGVSYFNYRGFAGMSGWTIGHINSLQNGFMMPLVISLTCLTGDFEGTGDCMSERFLKAGSPTSPKGAIAAISTATGNTHTCFNNCVDAGIFTGIFADEIYTPGGALVRGKLNLFLSYPDNPFDYVVKFSYWNNLMGDPGLDLWTAVPQDLVLDYEMEIPVGSNSMEILVTDDTGSPVENVWVTLLKGEDEIFVSDYTDGTGSVILPISADSPGEAIITASKHNYIPEVGDFEIQEVASFVNVSSYLVDDDASGSSSGNGDGLLNPGEIIELGIDLMNYGTTQVENVTASISTVSSYITILNDVGNFGDISGGSSSTSSSFVLEINEDACGDMEFILELEISDDSGNSWDDNIYLTTAGPYLEINEYFIVDGDDNIFQPGETIDLQLNIENIGVTDLEEIYAVISCDNDRIVINDADCYFGDIAAGNEIINSTDALNLTSETSIIPGSQISVEIDFYNSQGYQQNNRFNLQIGEVSVIDPLGPDAFGHFIYDSNDTQYINTPTFEWVEIDPNYGGSGTIINNLVDPGNMGTSAEIPLPFTMNFYGREYDSVTICTNGWFAPGNVNMNSFMNWGLPGPMGPSPMIAVFWDDLKLGDFNGTTYVPNGGSVCYYYDEVQNYFVIEWSRLRNEFDDQLETFQAIIYDPYEYPTSTGDCQILLQYSDISNTDQGSYETPFVNHGQYATIGIEDHTSTDGLQYTYNNIYPAAALPVENYTALMISGSPISMDDPYIVFSGIDLVDENGNDLLDYSEFAELIISLNNLGGSTASGVSAIITEEDEYITIISAGSDYNDIASGSVETSITNFSVQVADICPDDHIVTFHIEVQSDQGSWDLPFNVNIRAPHIILEVVQILDDNNGILDPGETSNVAFVFSNIGGSDSNELTANIDFTSNMVSSDTDLAEVGIIGSNSNTAAEFEFTADPQTEIGTEVLINWQITDELGYEFSGVYSFYVSQVPVYLTEEFETFPPDGWEIEGGFNWIGNFSNASGGTPPEALFWGGFPSQTTQRMITVPINTLGSNELILEFRHSLQPLGEGFIVGIETSDDGLFWNNVIEFEPIFINTELTQLTINTADVGSSEFRIAFYFEGDTQFINFWTIDDIVLNHVPIIPQSFIIGTVTLADGNGILEEATVSAGEFSTNPDMEGNFVLQVEPDTYDLTAYLPGYIPVIHENFEVPSAWNTYYSDFTLSEATIADPPQNLTSEIDIYNIHLQWDPPGYTAFDKHDLEPGSVKPGSMRLRSEMDNADAGFEQRSQIGYNLYRNDVFHAVIDDLTITEYDDLELDANEYSYYVTAVFDEGETDPSNLEVVTIILPPPANLTINSTPQGGNVILNWESPNDYITGFRVYRNDEFIVETMSSYYFDAGVDPGIYLYEVTALYIEYESEPVSGEIDLTASGDSTIPQITELTGNYPNPFNPKTAISYQLSEKGNVNMLIYNIKGQMVKVLIDEEMEPGRYIVEWDGSDDNDNRVSSGIYYYKMTSKGYSSCKKMILMK